MGNAPQRLSTGAAATAHPPHAPAAPEWFALTLGTALDGPQAGRPLVVRGTDAMAHKFVLGLTGSGKSSFAESLVLQAVNQQVGCMVLDPHGETCRSILRTLAATGFYADSRAYQRVLYVPFAGRDACYVPFNVLAQPSYDAHTVARFVLEAWTRAWPMLGGGAAPVVEQLVLAGCYTLVCNRLPLTLLGRLLSDSAFRQQAIAQVDDEEVVATFHRFDAAGRRGGLLSESTLRRTFLLLFSPVLRYSLGSRHNALSLPALMVHNTTVLCDLGGLDEETKRLLGCLIMVQLEAATLARATLPPPQRRPYQAIIDEAPVFMSQSAVAFEHLLAQARKFGVSLTLAAQVWGQTRKLHAVLPNAALIAFRLSHEDAATLTPWLFTADPYRIKHQVADPYRAAMSHPVYMSLTEQRAEFEQQLQCLPPREAIVRRGTGSAEATRLRTVALPDLDRAGDEVLDTIVDHYAKALLIPREEIEAQGQQPQQGPQQHAVPLHRPPGATVPAQKQLTPSPPSPSPSPLPSPSTSPPSPPRPHHRRVAPLPHGDTSSDGPQGP